MSALLRIFDLIDGIRDYVICSELLSIGREKSRVDICIHDLSVSRVHLKLFLRDGLYYIEDQGSSCGTYVNGKEITTYKLSFGDHIQIGSTVLEFISTDTLKVDPDSSRVDTDTVDALMSQYKVMPSKMDLYYRVLKVSARSLYKPGDTIKVGRGGLMMYLDIDSYDMNNVLELKITWPDGSHKILLGEIVATIKKTKQACVKLHHISEEKLNKMFEKMERGSWRKA